MSIGPSKPSELKEELTGVAVHGESSSDVIEQNDSRYYDYYPSAIPSVGASDFVGRVEVLQAVRGRRVSDGGLLEQSTHQKDTKELSDCRMAKRTMPEKPYRVAKSCSGAEGQLGPETSLAGPTHQSQ